MRDRARTTALITPRIPLSEAGKPSPALLKEADKTIDIIKIIVRFFLIIEVPPEQCCS